MRIKFAFSLMILTFIIALNEGAMISFAEIPKDLVLYMTFDKDAISGKEAKDLSQNGNNGTIIGGPKVVDGYIGQALDFNGASDSVEIATSESLAKTAGEMTMEAWVYTRADGTAEVISKWDNVMNGIIHFEAAAGGNMRFCMRKKDDSFVVNFTTGKGGLDLDTWVHVAEVYDGKTATVYFDGVEIQSMAASGDMRENADVKWWIGSMYAQGRWLNGMLDEVRIWTRALSEKEINENMDKEVTELLAVNKAGKLATIWGQVKNYK